MERLMAAAKRSGLTRLLKARCCARIETCAAFYRGARAFKAHDDPEDPEQVVVERELLARCRVAAIRRRVD